MKKIFRNSPSMKVIIHDYMVKRGDAASFEEIYEHVHNSVTLLGKTPRNSIFSVLTRIPDIERVGPAMYKLRGR